jgi:hypothetical protein
MLTERPPDFPDRAWSAVTGDAGRQVLAASAVGRPNLGGLGIVNNLAT